MQNFKILFSLIILLSVFLCFSGNSFAKTIGWNVDKVVEDEYVTYKLGKSVYFNTFGPADYDGKYYSISDEISFSSTFSADIGLSKSVVSSSLGFSISKSKSFQVSTHTPQLKKGQSVTVLVEKCYRRYRLYCSKYEIKTISIFLTGTVRPTGEKKVVDVYVPTAVDYKFVIHKKERPSNPYYYYP